MLISARVNILIDVKDEFGMQWVNAELEAALNSACTYLEQSSIRDTAGAVAYALETTRIKSEKLVEAWDENAYP